MIATYLSRAGYTVDQAHTGPAALEAARSQHPEVVVLDLGLPGLDGIEVLKQLREAGVGARCLMVTTFGRPGYLRRAMDAGASGFVVKDTPAPELAEAVRRVDAGLRVVDPALATESLIGGPNPLTDREREVLRQALDGSPVQSIAGHLFLSPGTVRNYLSSAIGKTGTATRVEAARYAEERGWL